MEPASTHACAQFLVLLLVVTAAALHGAAASNPNNTFITIQAQPFNLSQLLAAHTPASSAGSNNSSNDGGGDAALLCSCTYSELNRAFAAEPFSMLVVRQGARTPSFLTLLSFCNNPHGINLPRPSRNSSSGTNASFAFLATVLDELAFQLTALRLRAPMGPVLLQPNGWRTAQLDDTLRSIATLTSSAQARIASARRSELPTASDVWAGLGLAARVSAGFAAMLGRRLLGLPEAALTTRLVDRQANNTTPLQCNEVPALDELPLALLHWCKPAQQAGRIADSQPNCRDPYAAYAAFCAPAFCLKAGQAAGH